MIENGSFMRMLMGFPRLWMGVYETGDGGHETVDWVFRDCGWGL